MKNSTIIVILIIAIVVAASISVYFSLTFFETPNKNSCSNPVPNPYITEFCAIYGLSSPNAITVDSHGDVWFVLQQEGDLGVIYGSNSSFRAFSVPAGKLGVSSWGIAVDNSRSLVWFTDYADNGVWSFNINNSHFSYYNVTYSAQAFPYQIIVDKNGNVWFTEPYAKAIGELTQSGKQLTYPYPSEFAKVPFSGPFGLAQQANGTLWFTNTDANSIGSLIVNSSTGAYDYHLFNMTGIVTYPVGIAIDQHGNIWMTEHGPSLIAEFNPTTHYFRSITTFIPPYFNASLPYFVYLDSQGNVWFNEHQGNAIGRFSPYNDSMVEYRIPTKVSSFQNISAPLTMALSASGTPWFTEMVAGKVGRINLNVPMDLGFSLGSSAANYSLSSGHALNIGLNVSVQSGVSVQLSVFLSLYDSTIGALPVQSGGAESALLYSFSVSNGTSNFGSTLSLQDHGFPNGTYYLTVSAITRDIIVSRIIVVNVS